MRVLHCCTVAAGDTVTPPLILSAAVDVMAQHDDVTHHHKPCRGRHCASHEVLIEELVQRPADRGSIIAVIAG